MRRRVGREGHRFAGQVFDAVDALLADHAIGPARPIHHVEGARAHALILELSEILGPHVGGGEHHVDVVGGQGGRAFGPIVDDLEGDLQSLVGVNRPGGRIQPAVGHQPAHAADPDIHAYANVAGFLGRHVQRLGRIHFDIRPGRTARFQAVF